MLITVHFCKKKKIYCGLITQSEEHKMSRALKVLRFINRSEDSGEDPEVGRLASDLI